MRSKRWVQRLEAAAVVSFDTETTTLDHAGRRSSACRFCVEPGRAACRSRTAVPGAPDQLDRDRGARTACRCSRPHPAPRSGHHLKYDAHVLPQSRIELAGMRYDSMLESPTCSTAPRRGTTSIDRRSTGGVDTIHYEDVAGKGAKQLPFAEVPVETAGGTRPGTPIAP